MTTQLPFVSALVVFACLSGAMTFAPETADAAQRQPPARADGQQPEPSMQGMMKMHERMMAEMKAGDVTLDALVKDMNSATGDAKINAVARVVSELVRQHKAMVERMGEMHQQMMDGHGTSGADDSGHAGHGVQP
jgi:hypothetical protein